MQSILVNKVIAALVIASAITASGAIVRVARIEEKVMSQKEQIEKIYNNVEWIRNNWHFSKK